MLSNNWWKRIEALIGRADTVVFVLSPDAIASDIALKEVAHAASLNKRFAPIVYRRVEDGMVPEALRRLNFIFFDDPGRFEASADVLAEALQTGIALIRQHTEFGEAAHRWSAAGRPRGLRRALRAGGGEAGSHRGRGGTRADGEDPPGFAAEFSPTTRHNATSSRAALPPDFWSPWPSRRSPFGNGALQSRGAAADEQRQIAEQQRKRAEDTLAAATRTANSLVFYFLWWRSSVIRLECPQISSRSRMGALLAGSAHQIGGGGRCTSSAARQARSRNRERATGGRLRAGCALLPSRPGKSSLICLSAIPPTLAVGPTSRFRT